MNWNEFEKRAIELDLPGHVRADMQRYSVYQLLRPDFDPRHAEVMIALAKQNSLKRLKGHYDKETCEALLTLLKRGIVSEESTEEEIPQTQEQPQYETQFQYAQQMPFAQQSVIPQQPIIYMMQQPQPRYEYDDDEDDEDETDWTAVITWVICILLVLGALFAVIYYGDPNVLTNLQLFISSFGTQQ